MQVLENLHVFLPLQAFITPQGVVHDVEVNLLDVQRAFQPILIGCAHFGAVLACTAPNATETYMGLPSSIIN
jgi:hypothetical protein